ncbi:MAG: hypothetical protein ACTSRX_08955, partial [Promethearchaeota archaeon]
SIKKRDTKKPTNQRQARSPCKTAPSPSQPSPQPSPRPSPRPSPPKPSKNKQASPDKYRKLRFFNYIGSPKSKT